MTNLDFNVFHQTCLREHFWIRAGKTQTRQMQVISVIRDREGIYSGLVDSQATNRQLAVCYVDDGKLMVKISVVRRIINEKEGKTIVLSSGGDPPNETTVPLDHIQSIYPITDFVK